MKCKVIYTFDYILPECGTNVPGVFAFNNQPLLHSENYKTESTLRTWCSESLSLLRKIISLVASQFMYQLSVSTKISDVYVSQIEKIFENPISNGTK